MPRKVLTCLALLLLVFGGQLLDQPSIAQAAAAKTLWFSGYQWKVRSGWGGPGPNRWSAANVWKAADGTLHLKLAQQNNLWYAAELSTVARLGFGRYQFQVIGALDRLDPYVVLGLFNYPTAEVGPDGTNEIDIEFARWGSPLNPIGNYTVWPGLAGLTPQGKPFAFSLNSQNTTQRFTWRSGQVYFQSLRGFHNDDTGQYASWLYKPGQPLRRIGQQPMPVHINLWLFNGHAPGAAGPVEIIIKNFTYTP
jgi:hypothetical protein